MKYLAFSLLLVSSACGFEGPGAERPHDGAIVVAIDVAPSDDASPPDALEPTCPWPYAAEYAQPCAPSRPDPDAPLVLVGPGRYTYDTLTGVLAIPQGGSMATASIVEGDVRTWWVEGLRIGADATLQVIGPHPLAIVSMTDLQIEGELHVGSQWAGMMFVRGAGADPGACPSSPPEPGQTCAQHGGSGGGGGAFGGSGGSGGEGGDTRSCDGMDGKPGGAGGVALAAIPTELRGGCAGRAGAPSTRDDSAGGVAGPGGGAVALVARRDVTVTGRVRAGGAGGRHGAERAGGGGGGSGGMIVIEAMSIVIGDDGSVAANGGGGGGGCGGGNAQAGQAGQPNDQRATGGAKQGNGSDGGAGSGGGSRDGDSAEVAERGGGGGGGSAGFIRLNAASRDVRGTVSPPAS